ncbi:uncharacterized protein BDCG_16042 [Blastomyces dermatitidis ER-3]|uniref:Uncharacterized protein n=1 Tax=Ajellomyces dermatitidis (strain ER-3 / ATCC MYA-2586) TaxID=559297 RepID=A0ABX2VPU8_AJEDR|nr:uncharacterized protein BDCG_16042 [Blastomyces dermatitidis ER-3]OAS99256.1 hypothetical protein BDCG_16042 [Blastomyces dermatitidis ER-3]
MKREREKKSVTANKQQQKKIKKQKLAEKKRIEALFRSQMHFIIQNIEKTALLSEHVNLLTAEMKSETADQKIQDFEIQINLTEKKQ